ncbi:enhanced serine sensitivity protein SseB [Hymenobacter psychrophilus]|uniref:SseB protein N-terminal domain-containing protein n=1 Tax=Hymenobacter psychrophilus TaxID=651662 RepID=A0A1H3D618_9BACT|nr:enhanced serine sensitivity protein SseB [Hymenobacter psychrophilus]SDX61796.1 SseB protein N-terminal domain-containing protein [Hymenobacter psychrophilus]
MALFDFLKKKPEDNASAPATPTTAAESGVEPTAPAAPAAPTEPAGPRYKGSNYQMPAPEAPAPMPMIPPAPPIAMPSMMGGPDESQMDAQAAHAAFQPTNILEQLLMQASYDPQFRSPFYQALLGEELAVVLAAKEGQEPGEVTPTEGMEIQLQALHDGKIAIFSSVERIFDNGAVPEGSVTYMRLRGHDFFSMVQDADCAINPFSAVGKLMPADEIKALMAGQLFDAGPPQDVQVTLHQPEPEPTALLDGLRAYSAAQPSIRAVYLAEMRMQNVPEQSRLLVAFDTEETDPAFLQELGPIIQGNIAEAQFVDLMLIDPTSEEPLVQYLLTTEPVYARA